MEMILINRKPILDTYTNKNKMNRSRVAWREATVPPCDTYLFCMIFVFVRNLFFIYFVLFASVYFVIVCSDYANIKRTQNMTKLYFRRLETFPLPKSIVFI